MSGSSSQENPEEIIEIEDENATGEDRNTSTTNTASISSFVKKRSPIWIYFDECAEGKKAKCKNCQSIISRGGEGKTATNTAMQNHLKKHKDLYDAFILAQDKKTTADSKGNRQLTLEGTLTQMKPWHITDAKAISVNYAIAEMICTDLQPMSVVENTGFINVLKKAQPRFQMPSRKYLTTKILPDIYARCLKKMSEMLNDPDLLSFTTDIWTASNNNNPFISLTAHWISKVFEYKYLYLQTSSFTGSHSGENILNQLNSMFLKWNIDKAKIHVIIRDNAANMVKGLTNGQLPNTSCFIHTLQLAINDSISGQRTVTDTISVARRIVSHFSHSALGSNRLKQIQGELNLPSHKLIQDVSTRWNSTFYMLERILEQKNAISELDNLSQNQWSLAEGILSLLKPFEEVTKIVSQSESVISEVIPFVSTLISYMNKPNEKHHGVRVLKDHLKAGLNNRFANIQSDIKYTAATFIDPRYKLVFINDARHIELKESLVEEMSQTMDTGNNVNQNASSNSDVSSSYRPPAKKPNTETHAAFWDCFTEISNSQVTRNTEDQAYVYQRRSVLEIEISAYSSVENINRQSNPFLWWKENATMYPNLSQLVKKYLSAPASSVFSERLFSTEGIVYEDHRNRTSPENAEMITLLNRNLKLIGFEY